jgi:hypothetical protein
MSAAPKSKAAGLMSAPVISPKAAAPLAVSIRAIISVDFSGLSQQG